VVGWGTYLKTVVGLGGGLWVVGSRCVGNFLVWGGVRVVGCGGLCGGGLGVLPLCTRDVCNPRVGFVVLWEKMVVVVTTFVLWCGGGGGGCLWGWGLGGGGGWKPTWG